MVGSFKHSPWGVETSRLQSSSAQGNLSIFRNWMAFIILDSFVFKKGKFRFLVFRVFAIHILNTKREGFELLCFFGVS